MTFYRKLTCSLFSAVCLAIPLAASAQISQGDEYRTANDQARDAFGEDYAHQKAQIAEQNRNNGRVLSKKVGSYVQRAMKALQKPDYKKANAQIDKGFSVRGLTDYDQSILYQVRAAATQKQGDHTGAIESYEKAIATGGMTKAEIQAVEANIARLRQAAS